MRIAICFFGQLRTGVECVDNIKRYLGELYSSCDFFIHTWDKNATKSYYCDESYLEKKIVVMPEPQNVTEEYWKKFKEIYNPKISIIENYEKISDIESENFGNDRVSYPRFSLLSQFYSFRESVRIKKEFESDNHFVYDYVIKLRPDILFNPKRRLIDEIEMFVKDNNKFYIETFTGIIDEMSEWVNDVYYISSSKNIDIASEFYDKKKNEIRESYKINRKNIINGSIGFVRHLISNGIEICKTGDFVGGYAIYRTECLKYSPMDEWDKCLDCERYYYGEKRENILPFEYEHHMDFLNDYYILKENRYCFVNELEPKNNLVICGDSFSIGIGCEDLFNQPYGSLLSKKLHCNLINLAKGASTNLSIFLQVKYAIENIKNIKYVCIGVTSYSRTEWFIENSNDKSPELHNAMVNYHQYGPYVGTKDIYKDHPMKNDPKYTGEMLTENYYGIIDYVSEIVEKKVDNWDKDYIAKYRTESDEKMKIIRDFYLNIFNVELQRQRDIGQIIMAHLLLKKNNIKHLILTWDGLFKDYIPEENLLYVDWIDLCFKYPETKWNHTSFEGHKVVYESIVDKWKTIIP